MPDTPVDKGRGAPYDGGMEARVSRLEDEMRVIRDVVIRIEAMLAAVLPTLATKAELADLRAELRAELAEKPSKTYLWGILGVLVTAILGAFGAGLAAVAILH